MDLLKNFTNKELTVWAVVVDNIVVNQHIGPAETYNNPLSEIVDIKLIQYSDGRGFPKTGDIWDGERFRSQDGKVRSR
jgi:hypothetical protein